MSGISLDRLHPQTRPFPSAHTMWRWLRAIIVGLLALATVIVTAGVVLPALGSPASDQQIGAFLTVWSVLPVPALAVVLMTGASPGGLRSAANQSVLIGVIGWFLVFASLIIFGLLPLGLLSLAGLGLGVFAVIRSRNVLAVWGVALNVAVLLGVMFVRSTLIYM